MPAVQIFADQFAGRLGTFAASGIVRKFRVGQLRPRLFDWRDDAPLSLNLVTACKQRGISPHGIQQQRFIGRWCVSAESRAVGEVRMYWHDLHLAARLLGAELYDDAFVRLDIETDDIRLNLVVRSARE